jgi:RHS repeat-associated protein
MDYFSPAAIIDQTGAVTERYAICAFGIRTILTPDFVPIPSSECAWDFAFQGRFLDRESGLLDFGYRYYSPSLGRWASKDLIAEQGGLSLYGYVGNNPLNKTDAFGLLAPSYGKAGDAAILDAVPQGAFMYTNLQMGPFDVMASVNLNKDFSIDTSYLGTYAPLPYVPLSLGVETTVNSANQASPLTPALEIGNNQGGVFATSTEVSPYVSLTDVGPLSAGVGLTFGPRFLLPQRQWINSMVQAVCNWSNSIPNPQKTPSFFGK